MKSALVAWPFIKRTFDLVAAGFALILLSPLLGMISILVLLDIGLPILFRQQRPGRDGKPFTLLKFRTMRSACDGSGRPLQDAERLTHFGRALRAWSLDELPELINVLKGEMSIVGPRPLLMEYLPLYNPRQARRHAVRPGITGLAQVSGRNSLSWEEKFELDLWYVDNQGPLLDLKILAKTFLAVLLRRGVSQAGHATAEPFRGSGRA